MSMPKMSMSRRLTRSRPVQASLSVLVAGWLVLVARTTRWRIEGAERADALFDSDGPDNAGAVVTVWHGRLAMLYACWPAGLAQPAILISLSPDGRFVARAAERLGAHVIGGSTRRPDKRDKDKGGAAAYRAMIAHVRAGGVMVMTPDGPRGPRMRAGAGAVRLAAAADAPSVCLGVSVKWRIVLDTWDRFILPLPFGPGAIVWDAPVPPSADSCAARAELEHRLTAATHRADALAGVRPIDPASAQTPA